MLHEHTPPWAVPLAGAVAWLPAMLEHASGAAATVTVALRVGVTVPVVSKQFML